MKKRLCIGLALGMLVLMLAPTGPARAQVVDNEVIYLVDSATPGDFTSHIYRVDLDPITMRANLTLVVTLDETTPINTGAANPLGWNNVDVLAASPDGRYLYFIDNSSSYSDTNRLGRYEITTDTLDVLADPLVNFETDQGAMGPDGVFYITKNGTPGSLCWIDLSATPATVNEIDVIKRQSGTNVKVGGGDIAFGADGTLYMVTNESGMKLYVLTNYDPATRNPADPVWAEYKGDTGYSAFNGLAVRANGFGDLIASKGLNSKSVHVLDKNSALSGDTYTTYLGGSSFTLANGDMTTGPLTVCTLTIGYWKTHDWDGATVTLCGFPIDEELGKEILWDARGNNFSMLFAQLIAAKLNVNNSTGFAPIDDAEAWLCSLGIFDGSTGWNTPFPDKNTKKIAVDFWDALDWFNNEYHCDDL